MSYRFIPSDTGSMSRATVSLWLKNPGSGGDGEPWDWQQYPPPPDRKKGLQDLPANGAFVFYDPYGDIPFSILPIRGPPPMLGGFPPVPDSPGVRPHADANFMLTFGPDDQKYKYHKWEVKRIDHYSGVLEMHVPFVYADWPPPYRAYWKVYPSGPLKGQPLGRDGLLDAYTMRLSDEPEPDPERPLISPSFIGVVGGKIKVVLQSTTHAQYKGYMYEQEEALAMFAQSTIFRSSGAPGEIGVWGYIGPYWAGYQFKYKDASKKLMGGWPEFFVLDGPQLAEGWNHLLISWDIGQPVSVVASGTYNKQTDAFTGTNMQVECSTGCKAWIALNGTRIKEDIQRSPSHPQPPAGTIPDDAYQWPGSTWSRTDLKLKPEEILPHNAYLKGCPRDGIPRLYAAQTSVLVGGNGYADELDPGFYISFLGLGGGLGVVDHVEVPDPHTLDLPKYEAKGFSIPLGDKPFGVPATPNTATGHNAGWVMAELNVWPGKVTEISDSDAKLFIDKDGKATKPPVYMEAWGKPKHQLHFVSHWQKGINTGGSKAAFEQAGYIRQYKPDPQIGK